MNLNAFNTIQFAKVIPFRNHVKKPFVHGYIGFE